MASIDIQPLSSDIAFGAHVTGVTSEALDDPAVRAQLKSAARRSRRDRLQECRADRPRCR